MDNSDCSRGVKSLYKLPVFDLIILIHLLYGILHLLLWIPKCDLLCNVRGCLNERTCTGVCSILACVADKLNRRYSPSAQRLPKACADNLLFVFSLRIKFQHLHKGLLKVTNKHSAEKMQQKTDLPKKRKQIKNKFKLKNPSRHIDCQPSEWKDLNIIVHPWQKLP